MVQDGEPTLWGIHAGKTGDADTLFLESDVVALGWDLGDLGALGPTRDAFKAAVTQRYPNKKPGAIPVEAGQLFRFVHEMLIGDLVAYPSKVDREIHVGRVVGEYAFIEGQASGYPHRRAVQWLTSRPRTAFPQAALYEIGSAMSLFQIKNYAEAFRSSPEDLAQSVSLADDDEAVAAIAEELEQTTHDFVLRRLAEQLKGHPFEEFVANLLRTMGYRTRVAPEGTDGGVDIVAHRDELGFEPPIIKVQVKSGEGSVGDPVVSALYGKVSGGEFGLLVTLGTITSQARQFARTKSNLRLIDGAELVGLVLEHYDELDAQYKGLLPLKRVYVPEPLEGSEG